MKQPNTLRVPEQMREAHPFKKLLIGLDLSERTPHILEIASYLAEAFEAEIVVASVSNVSTGVAGNESDGSPANEEERKTLDSLRMRIHQAMGSRGDKIEVKILHGDPAQRITEYAEYADCDLIIVGSRSFGAFKKMVLGSVSSSIVATSKKAVLVIK